MIKITDRISTAYLSIDITIDLRNAAFIHLKAEDSVQDKDAIRQTIANFYEIPYPLTYILLKLLEEHRLTDTKPEYNKADYSYNTSPTEKLLGTSVYDEAMQCFYITLMKHTDETG